MMCPASTIYKAYLTKYNDISFGDGIQEIVGEEGDYTEDEEGEEELDENE